MNIIWLQLTQNQNNKRTLFFFIAFSTSVCAFSTSCLLLEEYLSRNLVGQLVSFVKPKSSINRRQSI